MIVSFSRTLARIPHIEAFLGAPVRYAGFVLPRAASMVVGWGRKPSFERGARFAQRRGIPCISLEDGLLRSVGLGRNDPPLSLVVDDLGIYYDAGAPSRLEVLIGAPPGERESVRAQRLIWAWRAGRVSKYNHAREDVAGLPERYVLVADQTAGDASIRFGSADAASFSRMIEAALDEYPDCTVVLKVHPEVFAGRKRGYVDALDAGAAGRVVVLGADVHPPALLERAAAVYAVTSQVGFEGLLWGRPVRVFGMPFYAGWGLTQDALAAPLRRRSASLEALAHAALVAYPRYVDLETGRRCEAEQVLAHLALQRRMRQRFAPVVHALRFSRWKKPIVRAFLGGSSVRFVRDADEVPAGSTLAVWGRREVSSPVAQRVSLIRLEDGFLRSVGLGVDLVMPVSWVADRVGIYFDSTRPSELETILAGTDFGADLLDRAASLRQRICEAGVSKYNVGAAAAWRRPAGADKVVLVPGQVESDASIEFGAPGIRRNMDLLRAVREANPDAYLLYKPHPDVVARMRLQGEGEGGAGQWCDEIVSGVAMGSLLDEVDEVHVLTSLAGFEALLRRKPVVCYGHPFYAGWGLTEDRLPLPWRQRRLTLDELVAGALILYPTYLSRVTGRFTTPERALDELLAWRDRAGPGARWLPWKRVVLRLVKRLSAQP